MHLPLEKESKENLDEVLKALERHIDGSINEVYERREFWKRTQQEKESFASYLMALQELASRCNFSRCCEKCEALQLIDRITTGIRDATTVEKLLSVGSNLTMADVKTICEADESAKEKCAAVINDTSIRKISTYKAAKKNVPEKRTAMCKFCGKIHEWKKEACPAFGKTCKN